MNTKTPLVSIIVPIYNAELYLEECLSSIASQTYSNIEVILINDGSTDNSGAIAKLFCNSDNRFQLFNQANSGVAAARNKGLGIASGEFIMHVDSDDFITIKAIEYLYQSIVENESDISVGSYIIENKIGEDVISHFSPNKYSFITSNLTGEYRGSLWNKLIRAEFCESIYFDENINYMEDLLFLMKVFKNKDIVLSITDEVVYFYRRVSTSYTNNITYESMLSSIEVIDKICELYKYDYSDNFLAHVKNKNKVRVLLNSNETQRNTFPESNKYLLHDKDIPLRHKIVVFSDLLHLSFPIKFYKFLNKVMSK